MSDTDRQPDTASVEPPLPEANFEFLVFSLVLQAPQHLGLFAASGGEGSEPPRQDLSLARHSIDLLGVLFEKTKGNLSLEEHRYLENSLTELRYRYVQSRRQGTPLPETAQIHPGYYSRRDDRAAEGS